VWCYVMYNHNSSRVYSLHSNFSQIACIRKWEKKKRERKECFLICFYFVPTFPHSTSHSHSDYKNKWYNGNKKVVVSHILSSLHNTFIWKEIKKKCLLLSFPFAYFILCLNFLQKKSRYTLLKENSKKIKSLHFSRYLKRKTSKKRNMPSEVSKDVCASVYTPVMHG